MRNALFIRLSNYLYNTKLTIKLNPSNFLDSKFTNISGFYKFNVYWRSAKLPLLWTSKTPNHIFFLCINDYTHTIT